MLTLGELGIPQGADITPEQMKGIRQAEFTKATESRKIMTEILDIGDLQLTTHPFEELLCKLLEVIRRINPAALFTFHPYEVTPAFDHPDHNVSGKLVLHAGAVADVAYKYPEISALHFRPELYLWTTRKDLATHRINLEKQARYRRNQYLVDYYPSQFSKQTQPEWSQIFDRINTDQAKKKKNNKKSKYREYWMKVR